MRNIFLTLQNNKEFIWGFFGLMCLAISVVDACNGDMSNNTACIGMALACFAKGHIYILEKRIERLEKKDGT